MKLGKYTITKRDEEGPCPWCSFPLYIGDSATETITRDGDVIEAGFCSSACAHNMADFGHKEWAAS